MTKFGNLGVESVDGEIRFVDHSGAVLGSGIEAEVVPHLLGVLGVHDCDQPNESGPRPAGILALTDTTMAAEEHGPVTTLTWSDRHDRQQAQIELNPGESAALRAWLETIDLSTTPVKEWAARRRPILEDLADADGARRDAEERHAPLEEVMRLRRAIHDVRRRYIHQMPLVPIARDPFDDAIVSVRMDPGGLDGPYWDSGSPARPAEDMPPSFVVLTGAMRVNKQRIEHTPYLCLPGPPVPFVVPEVLEREGAKAVVATVAVGPHTGYAISYFSETGPQAPPLPNEWGRREYWLRDAKGGPLTMGSSYDFDPAPDYDLVRWIRAGKLAWIAPRDPVMRLRWVPDRCPYLNPLRDYGHQRVQNAEVF